MLRRLVAILIVASLLAGCTLADRLVGRPSAADIVSAKDYTKLVVEIDHPSGYAPTSEAVNVLRDTLREVTAKSSVDIVLEASVPVESSKKYTDAELSALRDRVQTRKTGGDTFVLHILYVAGGYSADSSDSRVLGLASEGGPMTILKGNIRASASGGLFGIGSLKEENIERAVLVHEFGHAAGLVNNGAPMQTNHEDPNNRAHSSNKNSVMYWAIETSGGLQELIDGGSSIPYQFDANDKADLRALR